MELIQRIKKWSYKAYSKTLFMLFLSTIAHNAYSNVKFSPAKLHKNVAKIHGQSSISKVVNWQAMLQDISGLSELDKLQAVNRFFNTSLVYQEDIDIYGKKDHWAPITQTLSLGRGDCEDFAIAKYVSLRLAGVDESKLKLSYVHLRIGGPRSHIVQPHMVLTYQESPVSQPLILDSTVSFIETSSNRDDLIEKYSFNASKLWVGEKQFNLSNSQIKLSKWKMVVQKMKESGIELS